MRSILVILISVLIASCGGDSATPGTTSFVQLEERIITGRGIITTNDWTCEFEGSDGNTQFTDEYGFYVDRLGTASDGFFNWSATSGNTLTLDKQGLGDFSYNIQNIVFTTTSFTDDGFTATVNGQYFDAAKIENFPISCTRQGVASF